MTEKLFRITERYLSEQGFILSEGTIVDATIISAPSSTKNQDRERDPEMKQTKKGNTWHFGMKAHIGSDTQGRVHSVVVTDASVHDSVVMEDCLHGEEQAIYGDKAYASEERQQAAESQGIDWRVNRKARRGRKLTVRTGRLTERVTEHVPVLSMSSVSSNTCGGIVRYATVAWQRTLHRYSLYLLWLICIWPGGN